MKRRILSISDRDDEKILRAVAVNIADGEVGTTATQRVIQDLKDTLSDTKVGIAIAAPQIGESVRIFIVSPKAFGENADFLVCINPQLVKMSKDKSDLEEACLSIPDLAGTVTRSNKVTLRALDEHGNKFERGASGLLAQIFQHENDHLDGILYIDKAIETHAHNFEKDTDEPEKSSTQA